MALSEQERIAVQSRLTDAEDALHQLITGRSARVFVDQNGERVEYVSARISELRKYIAELKALLNPGRPSGPLNVWVL